MVLRRIFLLCAALAFLTACGASSDDAGSVSSTETESTASPTAAESDDAGETVESSGPAGSLDEYLGTAANLVRGGGNGRQAGGAGLDEDEALEQQRLVQQEIQICMQAQGFEYSPEEVGDGLRFFVASENTALSPLEYAETEGFGISTRFDAILEGDVDLTETASLNDEHLATLSEGAADAWQIALRGQPPERNDQGQLVDPETGEVIEGRRAAGGCTADAQTEVRGDVSLLEGLADEFVELEERIAADPRVAEIAREWIDCMNAEGFDYQDESEARQEINAEVRPLLFSFFRGAQDGDDNEGTGEGRGPGGGGNPLQAIAGMELSAEQDAELEALQDRERAIATASVACQGDTGEEIEQIRTSYESEFVTANREALEAFAS